MAPAIVVLCRLVEYFGAAVVFGSPLFRLYGLPHASAQRREDFAWLRPWLAWSAGALALTSLAGLLAQTVILAGSPAAALQTSALAAVTTTMAIGPSTLIRVAAALAILAAAVTLAPGRRLWATSATLGGVACASLAWMGHGGSGEGWAGAFHLGADVAHVLAAAAWIGALVVLWELARRSGRDRATARDLHAGLSRFSGVGAGVVAVLLVTGVINGVSIVGWRQPGVLWTTAYGRLLCLKLGVFAAMVALAAANRFRLAPALASALGGRRPQPDLAAVRDLRRSLAWETAAGVAVLAIVAWLGTLAPPAA
ncbi:MAG: copper homeostasis membrane protein CopD [Caulobacteraceae bacterium]|nr:copper homeostasis membrane protein CopD [Caulobacter sp.]